MLGQRLRLFSRRRRPPPDESRPLASPDGAPEPADDGDSSLGYELLLYGNEQILRGSDNGTLVAFAAIAFQQIRGRGEPHHDLGCALLMLSVLLCAAIHFAIGYAYLGRARRMIDHRRESPRDARRRRTAIRLAWITTLAQFVCVIVGTGLIILETPPAWLAPWLDRILG